MRNVLAVCALLAASAAARAAENCVPPGFYTSLPRDRDYYYGVARDPDTDQARDAAIRNLGKQVSGDVEGWSGAQVAALAGPCRDKFQVAASVARLLPKSDLLAGWEQDDFERCAGFSYVLVRIEKERVERFLKESPKFKKDLVDSLAARVEKVEADVDALKTRLDRLEASLGRLPRGAAKDAAPAGDAAKLDASVVEIRADLKAGKPRADVERKLSAAEDAYAALERRMSGYQAGRDAAEKSRLAALKAEKQPELDKALAKIDSGAWTYPDAARVVGVYSKLKEFDSLRSFCRALLARPDRKIIEGHEDFFAYMVMVADLVMKDDAAVLKDGEGFLKSYPSSSMYEAVKAEMNGVIMRSRMTTAASAPTTGAAPRTPDAPAAVAAGSDPCPAP
jgi:hypothetical protein